MAHSPLLRTLTRLKLDRRSAALVRYELALEDDSIALFDKLPNQRNFDEARWTDVRQAYESRPAREARQKSSEQDFVAMVAARRKLLKKREYRSRSYISMLRAWEETVPTRAQAVKATLAKTGFADWRPLTLSDCLFFEQSSSTPVPCGRVCNAEEGILDRRTLHTAISPKYVPKPHFKMERKRLQDKSAEFAVFVAKHRDTMPRPEDESSDEGLLTINESSSSEEVVTLKNGTKKRKRKTKAKSKPKPKKRTRKPPTFVKLYDCKVHDRAQLRAQAVNRFSLMQQRVPRVEFPPLERLCRGTGISTSSKSPDTLVDTDAASEEEKGEEEGLAVEELKTHGIVLPVRLPRSGEGSDEEQTGPTLDEITRYRAWRSRARPFFNERDRYLQSRVYRERASDREILHAAQSVLGFWAKVAVMRAKWERKQKQKRG